ncbi:gliding motility-associated-like protein [Taibaiella chishuiensis]|uniref:Gliding motility-associated-like protein n=1 Tax=Taibaiella chishuiensis TaxID=1434707 RepID=A0A2P8DA22_9BACT|nr:gliding motility-associated-like protein [Taibaiella chishuiensis]
MLMSRIFILIALFLLPFTAGFAQQAPLQFIANEGQWEQPFLYKGLSANADIYLEHEGITYVVGAEHNWDLVHDYKDGAITTPPVLKFHAYKMKWLGANPNAVTQTAKKQAYYHNYYLGQDPKRWKSRVGIYGNIDYKDLYPNIDLHLSSEKGHLKYDFIVKPGADPRYIRLAFEGTDGMKISQGNLLIQTSVGTVTEMAPYAYQYINGVLKEVPCQYSLNGRELQFRFPKGFDASENLIVDPVITFATLTGSVADNWGFTATYDHQGNFYAGGIVNGAGYPTTTGAFQLTFAGGTPGTTMLCDVSITKFNAAGSLPLFSTYLGGNQNDMPHSLVVDESNSLVVAGKTLSLDFPVVTGSYDTQHNGSYDIFLSKFNATGTALVGSTFLGGSGDDGINVAPGFSANQTSLKFNYGDDSRSEVIVDRLGNIYLAASTQSNNFPVTSNAAKSTLGGTQDGIFAKFNPSLTTLTYSTFIGGSANDAAYVLTLDTAESHVYVAGGTQSNDFHTAVTTGAYKSTYQGGLADGYICRFLNTGAYTLQKATFIGTGAYDQCYGVQTDHENRVYAMGQTLGAFPVSSGVYSNPGSPQFLIKLDSMLSTSVYSTVFGSGPSTSPNISPVAFLVDTCQNVYISGWGGPITPGSSTDNLPITTDAFQPTTDGSDFYFIVFSKNALNLLFGSFFGSPNKAEHVDGGTSRFDPQGVVYQAICASCGAGSAFPATPGAYAATKGSTNCNLGAVKIAFNLGSVNAQANANPSLTGCAPLTVNFGNTSSNATSYAWDFNDAGSTSTAATPTHTFINPGEYNVRMVAINPNACKTHDTVYLKIVVSTDTIHANFNYKLADTCTNPKLTLINGSQPMQGRTLADATFKWYFGDNTSFTGPNPPPHNYPTPGTYTLMMVMTDTAACNSPDTLIRTFSFEQLFVNAAFQLPDTFCAGDTLRITNSSVNGTSYNWTFGDGSNSTDQHPSHIFQSPGTYTIRLVSSNPNSCNKVDSASRTITINPNPKAAFSYTPLIPETNVPTRFVNQSQNAVRYQWSFGDGGGSVEINPEHQYARTGSYTVCLTAYNTVGCSDKVCKTVQADVLPLVDVPTGFSPNGDGSNDILYVRGYSIATMDFKIFNRWGELVFQSQNQNKGWDGTYKGKAQEMDAYAYTLQVTFLDGSTQNKRGNVTLLR